MTKQHRNLKISALAIAVEGVFLALSAMPAHADEAEAAALKNPTNSVEVGISSTSQNSAKYGEYNGQPKSGVNVNGGFSVRGGDGYGGGNGTTRWSFSGNNLGLTTRELGASLTDQGKWSLGIKYDELKHNLSDSYQTPYLGTMGGDNFILPPGFGLAPTTRAMTAGQLGALQTVNISSTRHNTGITAGLVLNREWDIKFDYNQLQQSGAKLQGVGAAGFGGATGEKVSILPMPTNYKTHTINLGLNWMGDKGHATGSYFGSLFRDNYNGVQFQTFAGANNIQTMSTPPSNDFHQANLTAGYVFSPRTKLSGGLSYGRNTQNAAYVYDSGIAPAGMMVTPSPTTSLNGVVVTKHADMRLTDQTTRDLTLSAMIKHDARENRTSSNIYNFNAISGAHTAAYPNTPLNTKKTLLEFAGDYRIDKKQQVRLSWSQEQQKRWCDQYAVNANYPAGTNCTTFTGSRDSKLSATYRRKILDDVGLNLGYIYSNRRSDFDPLSRGPFISTNGNAIVAGATITGINAGDFLGFHPSFAASRKEQTLKAGLNWDATEQLSFVLGGRYMVDIYNTDYGIQNGYGWSLNFDSTYAYSENGSVTAYVTRQSRYKKITDQQRSPTAAAAGAPSATAIGIPLGATWNNVLTDDDSTVGVNFKQGGLMSNKLDISGDFTYSLAKTGENTSLNYNTFTTGGLGCEANIIMSCGALPDIHNRMVQLKLTGNYQLDKKSKVSVGYLHRRLRSEDYYFNGLQYPFTPSGLMPTNQTAPNYAVNVISATYSYSFQ